MKKNYDLGRGISALFENIDAEAQKASDIVSIPISSLQPNPLQPRKHFGEQELRDLSASIEEHGVILPLVVRVVKGGYEIVAGERRFKAAQKAGLATVPAIVREISTQESFSIALIENLQRENLNAIEESEAFSNLLKIQDFTQEQLGKHIGKTRSYIANSLRLLTLPQNIQDLVKKGDISAAHARTLIGRPNNEEIAEKIVSEKMSVRAVENMIAQEAQGGDMDKDIASIERSLSLALGLTTNIHLKKNGGRIEILFARIEELETLVAQLYNKES